MTDSGMASSSIDDDDEEMPLTSSRTTPVPVGFLGPDVPENPLGYSKGPWIGEVGNSTGYRPDWRAVVSAASQPKAKKSESDAQEWEWKPPTVPGLPWSYPDAVDAPTTPDTTRQDRIEALRSAALTNALKAFQDYGVNPDQYKTDIEDRLAQAVAGIPSTASVFESYFPTDFGTKFISELETGRRNKLTNEFASVPTDFLPMTSDDPFIESLLGEQRTDADQFIQRMIDRGLISSSGAEGARKDLDRQAGLGRTRLSEIGTGLLTSKEAELDTERANRLSSIGQLKLGDPFDIAAQKTDLNKLATDFIGTLGEGLRTGLGSEKLFDTSGLSRIASGTGSATQPIAGVPQDDTEDELLKTGNEVLF